MGYIFIIFGLFVFFGTICDIPTNMNTMGAITYTLSFILSACLLGFGFIMIKLDKIYKLKAKTKEDNSLIEDITEKD